MVDEDEELRAVAQDLLARVHAEGRHEVAAALRTTSGRVHTGVHLAASARRLGESIALAHTVEVLDASIRGLPPETFATQPQHSRPVKR